MIGHVLPGFALVDEAPDVLDLLVGKFRLPAKLHASTPRGLHAAAGAF